jgi:hypothetical protein
MVTNTIHNNKLYHLIWYEYAKFLVNETAYNVFFVSSNNPMVKITKENLQHFKELSEIKTKYFDNRFVMEIELPAMEITFKQDHIGNRVEFKSNQMSDNFRGFCFDEFDRWKHKRYEELNNEYTKPIREARARGEDPAWNVPSVQEIMTQIENEYNEFCGKNE